MADFRSIFFNWLTVHTTDPTERRRGRLMALFLMTAIALILVLLTIDLTEHLTGYVTDPAWLIADISALTGMVGLFFLNRRGRVRLAAFGAIVLVITATALLMPLDTYNNSLVLLALPIALSSFVAFPAASLGTALLATLTYTVMNVLFKPGNTFNYFGVFVLFLLAVTIWLVSSWLERALSETRASEERVRSLLKEQQAVNAQLEIYYQDALDRRSGEPGTGLHPGCNHYLPGPLSRNRA